MLSHSLRRASDSATHESGEISLDETLAKASDARSSTITSAQPHPHRYRLSWWAATGLHDEAVRCEARFESVAHAEVALACVEADEANGSITANWRTIIPDGGDEGAIPF